VNILRAHVKNDRLSLAGNCAYNLGLSSAGGPIEKERTNMFGKTLAHKLGTEGEDNVFGDELADKSHTGVSRPKVDVVKHGVDVVEFSNKVGQFLGRQLFDYVFVNQLHE